MINLDFFKNNYINVSGKIILLIPFLFGLYKDKNNSIISVNLIFYSTCMTMILSYHRLYDLPLVVLFLIHYSYRYIRESRFILSLIPIGFLLFFLIPPRFLIYVSSYIGKVVGENSIIYLPKGYLISTPIVFPLTALIMLLLTVYSMFLFYLELGSEKNIKGCV